MRQGRDLWFTYGQVIDAAVPGEGRDRLKIGRLDLAVIADGVLTAGVMPVFVTVGGVVFGDAVDVWRDRGVGQRPETAQEPAGQRNAL